jgi:4-carboxymuconolactone decarboxylase
MRLPALTTLSARQQEISDRITSRRGGTRGPFLVWLRSPELCEKVEAPGAYCHFESSLDPRLRELSLLIAARHWDAQYSWNAHVGKAADLGISRDSLTALAENREPRFAARTRKPSTGSAPRSCAVTSCRMPRSPPPWRNWASRVSWT